MAYGSHRTGSCRSRCHLIWKCLLYFYPSSLTTGGAIEELKEFLRDLISDLLKSTLRNTIGWPPRSAISPHILASTLVEQAVAYGEEHEMTWRFAAGGFRDMTRIAESEPGMWTLFSLSNDIRAGLVDFKERLDHGWNHSRDNEEAICHFSMRDASTERKCRSISCPKC